jgi:hypothetical protein
MFQGGTEYPRRILSFHCCVVAPYARYLSSPVSEFTSPFIRVYKADVTSDARKWKTDLVLKTMGLVLKPLHLPDVGPGGSFRSIRD